ncbi:unnamed protein product [Cuscuta epithymum]|uniref:SHSP domain-containing protein n=2 Tax=Cuscuta epithymum TaxID=186058 RepID=A0AAV0FX23_9ASTE|nr:unnamed protein product [Cuscuta epithymum]
MSYKLLEPNTYRQSSSNTNSRIIIWPLPGFKREDINIEVTNRWLLVKGMCSTNHTYFVKYFDIQTNCIPDYTQTRLHEDKLYLFLLSKHDTKKEDNKIPTQTPEIYLECQCGSEGNSDTSSSDMSSGDTSTSEWSSSDTSNGDTSSDDMASRDASSGDSDSESENQNHIYGSSPKKEEYHHDAISKDYNLKQDTSLPMVEEKDAREFHDDKDGALHNLQHNNICSNNICSVVRDKLRSNKRRITIVSVFLLALSLGKLASISSLTQSKKQ